MVSNSQTMVETIFDFGDFDVVTDIIKLEDEGFIILGETTTDSVHKSFFIRLNDNGDTLWTKLTPYYGSYIVEYDSSHYYLSGTKKINSLNYSTIAKLDKSLSVIWMKSRWGKSFKIDKNINGHLVLIYTSDPPSEYPPDAEINIYDTNGNLIMEKGHFMFMADLDILSNGNMFCTGVDGYQEVRYRYSMWDTTGSQLFASDTDDTYTYGITGVLFHDTAIVINNLWESTSFYNLKISKMDSESGAILFEKVYLRLQNPRHFTADTGLNNQLLVAGSYEYAENKTGIFIFTFTSNGDSISTSYIDKFRYIRPSKIITYDDSYYLIGVKSNGYNTYSDVYFLKAPLDTVMVSIYDNRIFTQECFEVSPNPANSKLYFTLEDLASGTEIRLNNNSGIMVNAIKILPGQKKYEMNISSLSPGLYVAILMDKGRILDRIKVVISK